MNKTLSAMVAGAALFLASQASAVTIDFSATGPSGLTGIPGITYSSAASYGTGTFPAGNLTGLVSTGTGNGLGVNATPGPGNTPADAGFRNVIDSRADGTWEMLTVTFSSAVNLSHFILGLMDDDDDFEYSVNGGSFTSVAAATSVIPLTQETRSYAAYWTYVTSFSFRATGVGVADNDDFLLSRVNVSAVPLPAGAPLLLAGLAGLAALRRRKKAA